MLATPLVFGLLAVFMVLRGWSPVRNPAAPVPPALSTADAATLAAAPSISSSPTVSTTGGDVQAPRRFDLALLPVISAPLPTLAPSSTALPLVAATPTLTLPPTATFTPSPPPPPTAVPVLNIVYVVQPGDTFAGIAADLGVSTGELAAANPDTSPARVSIPVTR